MGALKLDSYGLLNKQYNFKTVLHAVHYKVKYGYLIENSDTFPISSQKQHFLWCHLGALKLDSYGLLNKQYNFKTVLHAVHYKVKYGYLIENSDTFPISSQKQPFLWCHLGALKLDSYGLLTC